MSVTDLCARCGGDCPMGDCETYDAGQPEVGAGLAAEDDWEPCDHEHDEDCYDYQDFLQCDHQHCFACGQCGCAGYCDDYETYNLRPSETGGPKS